MLMWSGWRLSLTTRSGPKRQDYNPDWRTRYNELAKQLREIRAAGGSYTHTQSIAATEWIVPHYLLSKRIVDIRVYNTTPESAKIQSWRVVDKNSVAITLDQLATGTAFVAVAWDYDSITESIQAAESIDYFLALIDTPLTYADSAGRMVVVNIGENALEFGDYPTNKEALWGGYSG